MKTYLKTDLAWVAGFIDGEGSISLTRDKKGCFHVRLTVTQANERTIRNLRNMFGVGYVTKKTRGYDGFDRKPCFDWKTNGQDTFYVLSLVHRYLRVKEVQSAFVIEFCKLQRFQSCGIHLPEDQKKIRIDLVEKFKSLGGSSSHSAMVQ